MTPEQIFQTNERLKAIMYSALGWSFEEGYWKRAPKLIKKKKKKGQVRCKRCKKNFKKEKMIPLYGSEYACKPCYQLIDTREKYNT